MLAVRVAHANRSGGPFFERSRLLRICFRTELDETNCGRLEESCVRDPPRLKSQFMPAPDDNRVLSPASSLVNNVNNDGSELLVPDRTIPVQRSLFRKARSRLAGSRFDSNRKVSQRRRFIEEFDDVPRGCLRRRSPALYSDVRSNRAQSFRISLQQPALITKLVANGFGPKLGRRMISDRLTPGASKQLRRSLGRGKTKYTGFLQIFSILPLPQLCERLGRQRSRDGRVSVFGALSTYGLIVLSRETGFVLTRGGTCFILCSWNPAEEPKPRCEMREKGKDTDRTSGTNKACNCGAQR